MESSKTTENTKVIDEILQDVVAVINKTNPIEQFPQLYEELFSTLKGMRDIFLGIQSEKGRLNEQLEQLESFKEESKKRGQVLLEEIECLKNEKA